jgi:ribosomal protein L19
MDLVQMLSEKYMKPELPEMNVGDTVKVTVRVKEGNRERNQAFEGTIIAKKHGGINETITVRIRVEYIDNAISQGVIRNFNSTGAVSLTNDELLALYPSQSIIWSVIVDAKTDTASTDTSVMVSGYGTTG